MPLQRVVDRHPLRGQAVRGDRPAAADRARAHPDAPPATCRGLRATRPGRPRARRCCRTCRARAPGAATPTSAAVHPQHPFAALDQKPLQRARDVPAVLDRPHAIVAQARAPSPATPPSPWRPTGPSARPAAHRTSLSPQRSCASACGCPHRARSLTSSTSTSTSWTPGGHGLLGALPRSYQVTPRASSTGDERHSERQSGPTADSVKASQLAAGRGAFTVRRTSPTNRIETASVKGGSGTSRELVPESRHNAGYQQQSVRIETLLIRRYGAV